MQKIAICDDDAEFCDTLVKRVSDFFTDCDIECLVRSFNDVASLKQSIEGGTDYNLLILDILFDDGNGMSCAKELRKNGLTSDIIFMTISKEYAIESFDVDPLYYILKPFDDEKLNAALSRFLKKHLLENLCLDVKNSLIKIPLNVIIYFEIYGHRIVIHKNDGSETVIRGSLKDLEAQLPQAAFVRPHRSYIVNMNYITEITRFEIYLADDTAIPISKARFSKVQLRFLNFLEKKDMFT